MSMPVYLTQLYAVRAGIEISLFRRLEEACLYRFCGCMFCMFCLPSYVGVKLCAPG